ncbi:uncharacterized protein LOC125946838 [Dermacentor silvarum]|uniref:uncharacterized protein LOC125946838 n=1 Tax=Dermacentor silvarum TaxID=543639 RepID=UPI002100A23B|nr:uncharacterized protein LOC125946838 [Dermacentor silvarum]
MAVNRRQIPQHLVYPEPGKYSNPHTKLQRLDAVLIQSVQTGTLLAQAKAALIKFGEPARLPELSSLLLHEKPCTSTWSYWHCCTWLQFLDVPDASSAFLGSLTGEAVTWGTPPRWRVCLRLAERTLPNLMQVAYEQVFKGSPIFDEVMGDIMVDEVRNGLVEFIDSLSILDAWSKIIAKIKVRDTKVYTFYPIVLADPKNLNAYVKKLERSVTWEGDIIEYYIRLRGFLAQMKEQDETLNFFLPRWKHSIFDPECVYYPRRDVVYVPVGFFNLTVPTSPGERMFHVPRAGPRLIGCFFRVILENTGLYKPEGLWWTEATRAAFQESMACLEERRNQMVFQHRGIDLHDVSRRLNLQGLSDIEDNVAVRVSVKVFD